jgi:hypothetical protein
VLQWAEFETVPVGIQILGKIMRRRAIIASALLILAGAWWHPARAATEIAFGITSQTAFSLAHYVAIEKKLYEAENLKVDTFVAGAAVQALRSGLLPVQPPTRRSASSPPRPSRAGAI